MDIDYAETQRFIQHFRHKGCDSSIVDSTEGMFNLCLYFAAEIDLLVNEIEKKDINIQRLKALVFRASGRRSRDKHSPDADKKASEIPPKPTAPADSEHNPDTQSPHPHAKTTEHKKENTKPKRKGQA